MVDELELGTIGSPEATLEIDDTENEFVLRDSNDNVVARRDESSGTWVLEGVELNGNNLVDSGTTVYNGGTNTVGDGTTSANHQTVSTGEVNNNGSKVTLPDGAQVDGTLSLQAAIGSSDGTSVPDIYVTDGTGSSYPYDTLNVLVLSVDGSNDVAFVDEFGNAFAKLDTSGNLVLEGSLTENGSV
jgi:hypothetical protein